MINVYIADDDADDNYLFQTTFNEVNPQAKITALNNGDELISTLQDNVPPKPDVIFLDLNMPKKNGFDTLTELRRQDRFKDIPIIIYTTSSNSNDIERTKKMGADYFITKPLDYKKLVDVLTKAVNKKVDGEFRKSTDDDFVIK